MATSRRSQAGEAATDVILATFRTNGLLLAAGDVLAADLDLTAARWQVLGAIALAERPITVPQIARRIGVTRQAVHSNVKRLVADGLVEFMTNADHRRSPLVRLTKLGTARYAVMDRRQAQWVNDLAARISRGDLATAARVLDQLCQRLDSAADSETQTHKGGQT